MDNVSVFCAGLIIPLALYFGLMELTDSRVVQLDDLRGITNAEFAGERFECKVVALKDWVPNPEPPKESEER